MSVVQFGGEGKWGSVGNEEGGKCNAVSERGGVIRAAAVPSRASGGRRRSGRLTGQAHLSVRGRRRGGLGRKGMEGDGPRLGRKGREGGEPRLGQNRCSG
jgi:hypothetical protein